MKTKELAYKITADTSDAVAEVDKLKDSMEDVEEQSEKTSKSVDDVAGNGGAIAILDGLTGGLATRFRDAYEASRLFNVSLKAQRTALIATGIGAFIVALGVVVAYWDDIVDFVKQTNKHLEQQVALAQKNASLFEAQLATVSKQIELNKLQGKSNEELQKQQIELTKKIQDQNDAYIDGLEKQLARLKATVTEVGLWDSLVANAQLFFGLDITKGSDLLKERELAILDLEIAISGANQKAIDLQISLFNLANGGAPGEGVERGQVEGVGGITKQGQSELDSLKTLNDLKLDIDAQYLIDKERLEGQSADRVKAIEQSVADAKVNITNNTLGLLSQIAKEGSSIGKALAVGQATISGYEGVQNAFTTASKSPITTLFPAYPFIQAGLAGAFSALQIKKILSTDPTGKTQTSVTGDSTRGGAGAPQFNLVRGTDSNQILETIQEQNLRPAQAFVVSSNVTSGQELDRSIVETSTL